jgi:hypothetical protein
MKLNRRKFVQLLFVAAQAEIFLDLCSGGEKESPSVTPRLLPNADRSPTPSLFLPTSIPSGTISAPQLECPSADYHRWKTWNDVGAVMRRAPNCAMCQNWLPEADHKLRSGTVAVAHYNNDLIVYAELTDDDIFNPAKRNGVEAFKQGDVLEIFLRAENEENYLEHHITPDNYVLQFRWPSVKIVEKIVEEFRAGKHPDYLTQYASHIPIRSQTVVQSDLSLWRIFAVVPLELLASHPKEGVVRDWRFSFSRYDYTQGEKTPILSSTSALKAPNFHELTSWGKLSLM